MRNSWVERHRYNPEYLYAITVCGDSMATTLHDGDIVVINMADQQLVDGSVYAFN